MPPRVGRARARRKAERGAERGESWPIATALPRMCVSADGQRWANAIVASKIADALNSSSLARSQSDGGARSRKTMGGGRPTAHWLRANCARYYRLAKGLKVPNDKLSREALLIRWKSVPA